MTYITRDEYKYFYNITDDSQNDLIDEKINQAENLINDRLNIDTFHLHTKTFKQQYIKDGLYKFRYIKINDILSINNIPKNENVIVFNYSVLLNDSIYDNTIMEFNIEFGYSTIPYLVKEVMYKIVNYLITNQNLNTVAGFDIENIKSFKQGDLSVTLKDGQITQSSTNFYITKNVEDEIKRLYKLIGKKRSKIYHN